MKQVLKLINNQQGMGILQVSMAIAFVMYAGFAMNQRGNKGDKQAADMEFRVMMEQYRIQTLHQVLSNPHNCKCYLRNLEFNEASATRIDGVGSSSMNQLGQFSSDCSTVSSPFLTSIYGTRDVKVNSVALTEVTYNNFAYQGSMVVTLQTNKSVSGSSERSFKVPVAIKVRPASAGRVAVTTCSPISTNGEAIGSLIKVPLMDPDSDKVLPITSSSGSLRFDAVPPTATGVFLQYMIGSPSNGRSDRNCDILGSSTSIKIGMDSKGDGGQRYVAGTAYVPLDGCAADLRYNCNNSGNRGQFRVLAYVDDGKSPLCANTQFTCPTGQVPDGIGGCVPALVDSDGCQPGYIYDLAADGCIVNPSASCPAGQALVNGTCNPMGPMQLYITNYRLAHADMVAKQGAYSTALSNEAAAVTDSNNADAAASAAASAAAADPMDAGLAAAASAAASDASAAASALSAATSARITAYNNYRAAVIYHNTFDSVDGDLPVP